jgi:hypothetical protein
MADTKITGLLSPQVTTNPATDVLPIVNIADTLMASSGSTRKITVNQLLGAGGTATLASATITGAATVGTTLGVTGVSTFAAGTAALPALTTTGDTNTGIYYPAADTFGVTTGGVERYRVDPSGNLLVGTTAAGGSASNSSKSVAGFFSTVNGTTASTASGSAVTMFASPTEATFIVSAYIFGTGAPATYNAVAIVKVSGGVATVTTISSSTSMAISVSGLNVQATQTSGAAQVIVYSAIRIS